MDLTLGDAAKRAGIPLSALIKHIKDGRVRRYMSAKGRPYVRWQELQELLGLHEQQIELLFDAPVESNPPINENTYDPERIVELEKKVEALQSRNRFLESRVGNLESKHDKLYQQVMQKAEGLYNSKLKPVVSRLVDRKQSS